MHARINGEPREFQEPMSIAALLEALGTPLSGIAVARNGEVIPRSRLSVEFIADGDTIEIIRAVAGG